ncbi:hypothetical protein BJV77DRAFT_1022348 [Russula vinacea]|nr:hypothetical protein BJV77DRAFT_1022348 [Russula vinacea]
MYERVLRYHGPLIYEAKVLKCETWDETSTKLDTVGPHHLVHYKGWKQTCVSDQPAQTLSFPPSDSDSAFTAGMSQPHLQKDLSQAQATATSASASASKTSTSACGAQAGGGWREEGGRGTKRGREDDDGTRRPEIAAGHATGTVPDMLKVLLMDDWDAVTKNSQCVCLSASCSPMHLVLS